MDFSTPSTRVDARRAGVVAGGGRPRRRRRPPRRKAQPWDLSGELEDRGAETGLRSSTTKKAGSYVRPSFSFSGVGVGYVIGEPMSDGRRDDRTG